MTAATTVEVLEPGQRSLRELADEANREHELARESGAAMVEHAIRAGEVLEEASGQFESRRGYKAWLAENFHASEHTSHLYRRLARYQNEVRASGAMSIAKASRYLAGSPDISSKTGPRGTSDIVVADMRRMRTEGWTYKAIAAEVGVSQSTVMYWVRPATKANVKRRAVAAKKITHAAEKALREEQRNQAIKRAVRKAGAATAEAYAMAERFQDVIAQAQRETEDRDARRTLSEAAVDFRRGRDKIVRALGVS